MDAVIVVREEASTNASGAPLVQYEIRCPHCGYEWVANLYDRGTDSVHAVDYCATCEEEADPSPVTRGDLFAQLPPAPTDQG